VPVLGFHMLIQVNLLRKAMILAIDASSRATGNWTDQRPMVLGLMVGSLVFAPQVNAFLSRTVTSCASDRLGVLGVDMSHKRILRSEWFDFVAVNASESSIMHGVSML
jgi:hypothetical protein